MPGKVFNFFRTVGKVSVILSPVLIIGVVAYITFKNILLSPVDPSSQDLVIVEIAPGTSFRAASKSLEEQNLVTHWWSLEIISKIKGNNTIVAGEYQLAKSMSPDEILTTMLEGKVYKRRVVFREGQSTFDLGDIVEKAGLVSRSDLNSVLIDPVLISKSGVKGNSFEGYLFPETYFFSRPIKAEEIILAMLKEGNKRWTAEYEERAAHLGWDRHQVLTLASIIEKESGNIEEQPTIASVFYNRLTANWPLQSDPTAVYGIPGFTGRILKKHLDNDNAYNTYKIKGLPPGPICSPGEGAIRAALYPANTTYMYFVADGQGGHVFSATQKEHERAVEFYRRFLKEARKQQALDPEEESVGEEANDPVDVELGAEPQVDGSEREVKDAESATTDNATEAEPAAEATP